jgi:Dyp-type peroxidase family
MTKGLDLGNVQSNVLRGYRVGEAEPHHAYLWLSLAGRDAARAAVAMLLPHVTSCARWDARDGAFVLNVALSHEGLQRLGVPSDVAFPAAFVEGMRARAERLGDTGDSGPASWERALAGDDLHALVTISGADEPAVAAGRRVVEGALGPEVKLVTEHRAAALPGKPPGTEHFGFVDGIGQPFVAGSGLVPHPGEGTPHERTWVPIATGEFVLGHAGEQGSQSEHVHPWLADGSYLAMRRLEERVAELREYVARIAALYDRPPEWIAAKMIGRWPSGAPLELAPDRDDPALGADPARNNDFHYREDAEGHRCPFGAHVRRANPRDDPAGPRIAQVRRHRIIRRAVPYGPWLPDGQRDEEERGVMFGVICADLENQFEYVQLNWINAPISSRGLSLAADRDPVVGANEGTGKLVVPRREGPVICWELPRFVRMRGGAYFFLPSLRSLGELAG